MGGLFILFWCSYYRFVFFWIAAAQVFAAPLVVITGSPDGTVHNVHQMPDHIVRPQVLPIMRRPCGGHPSRFKQKAVELSNFFRQALGLPLIAGGGSGHDSGKVVILPFVGTPGSRMEIPPNFSDIPHPHPHHRHHSHRPHPHHRLGQGSFISRVNYSLMNLGRWEGRVVAFVLGKDLHLSR